MECTEEVIASLDELTPFQRFLHRCYEEATADFVRAEPKEGLYELNYHDGGMGNAEVRDGVLYLGRNYLFLGSREMVMTGEFYDNWEEKTFGERFKFCGTDLEMDCRCPQDRIRIDGRFKTSETFEGNIEISSYCIVSNQRFFTGNYVGE